MRILEELWHGNITPQIRRFNRGTRYDDALKMMCRNEEKLEFMLEGKEKETFEKLCECRDEMDQYTEEDIFITGFRLRARMVIESFCDDDGFFIEIDA